MLASLFILSSFAFNATAASLTGLGHLPGEPGNSIAVGVSTDGSVVTGTVESAKYLEGQAFRWTQAEGMVGLGDLPGGNQHSRAGAVSGNGKVIVGYGLSTNTLNEVEGFRWTEAAGMTRLFETIPSQTMHITADGLAADGTVAAGTLDSLLPLRREAFRWNQAEGMTLLGDLAGGGFSSTAYDISADGTVVVGDGTTELWNEAYRWTSTDGMVGLGFLPDSQEGHLSLAFGGSAAGDFVVGYSSSAQTIQAYRWNASEGMVGLGYLSVDGGSGASDVSANGETIVGFAGTDDGQVAIVWTHARGMRSLWDVLDSLCVSPAADGWESLVLATRISEDGRFVVGHGIRGNLEEAFLADIAPQLTFSLVATGFQLTWPTGFQLQRTTALSAAPWQNVAAAQPLVVSFGAGNEFFRLVEVP